MHNKDSIVAGIRNLMKTNYDLRGTEIDLYAQVDETLTFTENWNKIKPVVVMMCTKRWVY